jgi:peptidoglycan/LPS O-acetylase OafA/YrhL
VHAHGASFNAPVWSVSVEVALYALFFIGCRFLPVRAWLLIFLAGVGFVVSQSGLGCATIARGTGSFFVGGCMYLAYRAVTASRRAR